MEKQVTRFFFLALRLCVGALFVYAGSVKALDPASFARDIENYRILPHVASVAVSLYLPYLEILCGLNVVFGKMSGGALLLIAGMMLVFTGALISAAARDLNISCGCFGSHSGRPNYILDLVRDAAILASAVVLWGRAGRETR